MTKCKHYIPYTSADLTKGKQYQTDLGKLWVRIMGAEVRFGLEQDQCYFCGRWADRRILLADLPEPMAFHVVMDSYCWAYHKSGADTARQIVRFAREAAGIPDPEPCTETAWLP